MLRKNLEDLEVFELNHRCHSQVRLLLLLLVGVPKDCVSKLAMQPNGARTHQHARLHRERAHTMSNVLLLTTTAAPCGALNRTQPQSFLAVIAARSNGAAGCVVCAPQKSAVMHRECRRGVCAPGVARLSRRTSALSYELTDVGTKVEFECWLVQGRREKRQACTLSPNTPRHHV